MGTRSLTVLMDDEGKEIAVIYRQFDSYPSVHGAKLARSLKCRFNDMNCLAAQLIAQLKDGVGDIYLYPARTIAHYLFCYDYIYTVYNDGLLKMKCQSSDGEIIFDDVPEHFDSKQLEEG